MSEPEAVAIERAVQRYRLRVPRAALAGRVGGVLGARAGGSLELHDFREYQPGDDLRQLDWNAVARTDQLVVRTRREEVSPRVEVIVDTSRSMAITDAKRQRTLALATVFARIAQAQGLSPSVVTAEGTRSMEDVPRLVMDGTSPPEWLSRMAPRSCGIRIVVSDFLYEAPFDAFCGRLAERTSVLGLVQVLDPSDLDPVAGEGVRLVDAESGEQLDRLLSASVLRRYQERFATHQSLVHGAARRAQASLTLCSAGESLEENLRRQLLGTVLEVRA